ncbi:C40 family peptidase [Saccharibacillus kuerlensis]|uniref:Peptidase P60 n=1 Tax=Saccharibacillus kuerlensis TaxID=459527 RepID=A0ABQ2L4Q7_9BACL|nr:C40 family peptidase [Saccharibacillus kuerlensis]GGO00880.1 peptidase P60 [Saccharibacillus kuerlensis]
MRKIMHRSILIAVATLLMLMLLPVAPNQASAAASKKQVIAVPAATLWKSPGIHRKLDLPSLGKNVDLRAWTSAMNTTEKRRWLTGKTETQALYGQEVKVLQRKGNWVQVAVVEQSTAKNSQGYPGWMPEVQLAEVSASPAVRVDRKAAAEVVVASKTANLYKTNGSTKLLELSFGTRLPVVSEHKGWIKVDAPRYGYALLRTSDVKLLEAGQTEKQPTGTQLVETGKAFLGLPYLWAGTSAYGFDCSGFTGAIYRYYGILLPRDASEQALAGKSVAKADMQPGDLMFFAYQNGKGKVHHVSMYIGGGKMMHAPKAGKTVEIIPISTASYAKEFAGARRYLNN